jgi:hypothetical protein
MSEVTFYHHERADGGRRTGVTVNGLRAIEDYAPGGNAERDPRLKWYADVIDDAAGPTDTQEAAAEWFAERSVDIRAALESAAEQLETGLDMDGIPWSFEYANPNGRPLRVSISAMRRYNARDISGEIRHFLGADWERFRRNTPLVGEGIRAWPTGSSIPIS